MIGVISDTHGLLRPEPIEVERDGAQAAVVFAMRETSSQE